ncbi:transposase [Roseateles sp. DC23W]|uniref:Transposase n=1 Tax=Pelomonas dachongensis TaxID=3299029 RepID=A0ABW7EGX0_9BURK
MVRPRATHGCRRQRDRQDHHTLSHWGALTHHLEDGAVALDNNHLERQIKPWAMGRRAGSSWVASSLASAPPSS